MNTVREVGAPESSKAVRRSTRGIDVGAPAGAIVVAALLAMWVAGNNYRIDLVILTCAYALIALGMYVPFIMARSLSIAYGVYAAIGAYSVALIASSTSLPVWTGWIIGAILSAIVAIPLSLSTIKVSGFYLAAITLLFSEAFEAWLSGTDLLGGASGIGNLRALTFFGWQPGRLVLAVMAMILVIVLASLLERLRRSPWGVTVRYMEDRPLPVDSSGIKTRDLKTLSLSLGAAVASLGGALFTTSVGTVTPETWTLDVVFLVIFIPLLGGRRTVWGAVLGALVVVELTLNVSFGDTGGRIIVMIAVLVVLLAAPNGLLGFVNAGFQRLRRVRKGAGQDG